LEVATVVEEKTRLKGVIDRVAACDEGAVFFDVTGVDLSVSEFGLLPLVDFDIS